MTKVKGVAGDDLYYHKVADAGSLEFSQPRAVDVLASYQGNFVGMEWKLHKTKGAFALKHFRQHQYDELDRIAKSGGWALIVIGVYVDGGKHQEVYIIPFAHWGNLITDDYYQPLKSVKLQDERFDPYRLKLSKVIDHQMAATLLNRIVGTK